MSLPQKGENMTLEDLLFEIKELLAKMDAYNYDREKSHLQADDIIIAALRIASRDTRCDTYSEIADAWERCRAEGFYYI